MLKSEEETGRRFATERLDSGDVTPFVGRFMRATFDSTNGQEG